MVLGYIRVGSYQLFLETDGSMSEQTISRDTTVHVVYVMVMGRVRLTIFFACLKYYEIRGRL